jgi:hypothetical protein
LAKRQFCHRVEIGEILEVPAAEDIMSLASPKITQREFVTKICHRAIRKLSPPFCHHVDFGDFVCG